jgi:hypothetical protein
MVPPIPVDVAWPGGPVMPQSATNADKWRYGIPAFPLPAPNHSTK